MKFTEVFVHSPKKGF